MRRIFCVQCFGVVIGALALAGALGIGETAEARSAAVRDCGAMPGSPWRSTGESGNRWRVAATSTVSCSEGPRFVQALGSRVASSGTIDVVRFQFGVWYCFASRSSALGVCTTGSGTAGRIVVVVPASRAGTALVAAFVSGGGADVIGPIVGGSDPGGLPSLREDEPSALRPKACTARPGSTWSRAAPEGDLWLAYAGGGITCLAAQGWIVDVSARMPVGPNPAEFDGGDRWRCLAGPNNPPLGARVGACARTTNWRTSLEPRFAVIAGGVAAATRTRLASYGYDGAVWEITRASAASFSAPRRCSFKGISWRFGTGSGDRWLVGTSGGYPCSVAAGAATKLVGRTQSATSNQSARLGVRNAWRCQFVAATRTTTCTWAGAPTVSTQPPLKLVFTPERAGGRAIVDSALGP